MKTAVIISGGSLDPDFALAFLREEKPELLIGADRGICFLKEKEIHPTHIVGDFDSASGEALEYFKQFPEIPIRTFNPVKDFTDTAIAMELAMEQYAFCPDTVDQGPEDASIGWLADTLRQSDKWFFWWD